jgi:ubiquinone/menaquinone biosynthesis C-methylase UbiE
MGKYLQETSLRYATEKKQRELSKRVKKKSEILDLCCGKLRHDEYFPNCNIVGLDADKSCNPDVLADAHDLPFKENKFDAVFSSMGLEHLRNPFKVAQEIYKVLKPNGILILSTVFALEIHGQPHDYLRFTEFGLKEIFKDFKQIEIYPIGNRKFILENVLGKIWTFATFNIFNKLISKTKPSKTFPQGYVIMCKK